MRNGHAEYQLVFTIETGPINADATISLSHGGRVVAQAAGRDGGPRIILRRAEVVATAVQRALEQFDSQLARMDHGPQPYGHPSQGYGQSPYGSPAPYPAAPYGAYPPSNPYGQIRR